MKVEVLALLQSKHQLNDLVKGFTESLLIITCAQRAREQSNVIGLVSVYISESAVARSLCRIVTYSSEPNTKVYGMWPHPFKHFFPLRVVQGHKLN